MAHCSDYRPVLIVMNDICPVALLPLPTGVPTGAIGTAVPRVGLLPIGIVGIFPTVAIPTGGLASAILPRCPWRVPRVEQASGELVVSYVCTPDVVHDVGVLVRRVVPDMVEPHHHDDGPVLTEWCDECRSLQEGKSIWLAIIRSMSLM